MYTHRVKLLKSFLVYAVIYKVYKTLEIYTFNTHTHFYVVSQSQYVITHMMKPIDTGKSLH